MKKDDNIEEKSFGFLQGLSDDELDELLDDAADEEDMDGMDAELISAILDELKRRGSNDPILNNLDIEKAYARFLERLEREDFIQ